MQIRFTTAAVLFLALTATMEVKAIALTKHHQHMTSSVMAKSVIFKPNFSWTGMYLGVQGSKYSSQYKFDLASREELGAKFTEKLGQFRGGLFTGFNYAVANGAVLGIETDMIWKQQERSHSFIHFADRDLNWLLTHGGTISIMTAKAIKELHTSFKEKWTGATRVRLGFAKGKILPYVAGGIAYSNILTNADLTPGPQDNNNKVLRITNNLTTMIGWTAGAGVDCALTNKLLVRLEYRYNGFGKKSLKYSGENKQSFIYDFKHNTHDIRAGLAYKF